MSTVIWRDVSALLREHDYTFPDFPTSGAVFTAGDIIISTGNTHATYELASVTKLLTTWAILRACTLGHIDLDDPLPEGFTLRHLLSHASGLPREATGKTLAPQRKRLYSNWGIERAAKHLESAVQETFDRWLTREILIPLGMAETTLDGSPAHGARSTVTDLVTFAREILTPTLVHPDIAAQACSVQFPELDGRVPGYGNYTPNYWGLGLEIRGQKTHWLSDVQSPHTVGHFGVAGSYLWIDPERGAGAAFLGAEPFGQWHQENWIKLNAAIGQLLARN